MFSRGGIPRRLTRLATFGEINHPQCFGILGRRQARWTIKGVDLFFFLEGEVSSSFLSIDAQSRMCSCCSASWRVWVIEWCIIPTSAAQVTTETDGSRLRKIERPHLEFGFNVFCWFVILIEAKMWLITLMFQIIFFFFLMAWILSKCRTRQTSSAVTV